MLRGLEVTFAMLSACQRRGLIEGSMAGVLLTEGLLLSACQRRGLIEGSSSIEYGGWRWWVVRMSTPQLY